MVAESFLSPPSGVKCVKKFEDVVSAKGFDCRIDSGFLWSIIDASPDANEIKSMCQSATCVTMFDSMRAVAPTECVTASGWYLYADLLNPILQGCESVPTPVTTGEAPYNGTASKTPAPTTAVTVAPSTSSSTATTAPATTALTPTATPVWVTTSPVVTTATPVADTSTQIVNTALSRGTIIAILSASVVVLTTITGLVKFFYNRRQQKKYGRSGNNNNVRNGPQESDDGDDHDYFAGLSK